MIPPACDVREHFFESGCEEPGFKDDVVVPLQREHIDPGSFVYDSPLGLDAHIREPLLYFQMHRRWVGPEHPLQFAIEVPAGFLEDLPRLFRVVVIGLQPLRRLSYWAGHVFEDVVAGSVQTVVRLLKDFVHVEGVERGLA